jgi:hypothetical protein
MRETLDLSFMGNLDAVQSLALVASGFLQLRDYAFRERARNIRVLPALPAHMVAAQRTSLSYGRILRDMRFAPLARRFDAPTLRIFL